MKYLSSDKRRYADNETSQATDILSFSAFNLEEENAYKFPKLPE